MNKAVQEAVASTGYYGRDAVNQRARIENGQIIAGGPDTVLTQIMRLRDELGAGILDLTFHDVGERDQTRRAIELFGTKVLPRMRQL